MLLARRNILSIWCAYNHAEVAGSAVYRRLPVLYLPGPQALTGWFCLSRFHLSTQEAAI